MPERRAGNISNNKNPNKGQYTLTIKARNSNNDPI